MQPSQKTCAKVTTKGHDERSRRSGGTYQKRGAQGPVHSDVFVFRARRADRMKLQYWDGTGLVMACKRLAEHTFIWPAIKEGLMPLKHAQFEALFLGLDWRKVRALSGHSLACGHKIELFGKLGAILLLCDNGMGANIKTRAVGVAYRQVTIVAGAGCGEAATLQIAAWGLPERRGPTTP